MDCGWMDGLMDLFIYLMTHKKCFIDVRILLEKENLSFT